MSWYRKVKSMYSISFATFSFIIWSTLCKWLFKSPVDYKLFFICLGVVFASQYLNNIKLKVNLLIVTTLGVSVVTCFIFFKGQTVLLNTIFLLFMALITHSLEDSSIDYSQYKQDIGKSMIALAFIWIISFTLGNEFVNAMYRFHILYIIEIIVLMRETRRYVYAVKNNKSLVTNIVIGIAVLILSLDYARKLIAKLLELLMNLASFILVIITSVLTNIFGRPVAYITEVLRKFVSSSKNEFITKGTIMDKNLNKQPVMTKYESIVLPPQLLTFLKIIILLLILYGIYKFLSKFTSKTKIHNGFVEEKERIVKKRHKNHWVKNIIRKIFEQNKSNREKILYTYKEFEKTTQGANIYKPYMTATQLKNVTKINVKNFDSLDDMTQVYNEAKFSLHPMTQENVERVKKGHINIKKQL